MAGPGAAHSTHAGGIASVQSGDSGRGHGPGLLVPAPSMGQLMYGHWAHSGPQFDVQPSQIVRRALAIHSRAAGQV